VKLELEKEFAVLVLLGTTSYAVLSGSASKTVKSLWRCRRRCHRKSGSPIVSEMHGRDHIIGRSNQASIENGTNPQNCYYVGRSLPTRTASCHEFICFSRFYLAPNSKPSPLGPTGPESPTRLPITQLGTLMICHPAFDTEPRSICEGH
jgi:hypothetical protein